MPDYAPSATPRYKLIYNNAGVQHSVQLRGERDEAQGATVTRSQGVLESLFASLSPLLCTDLQFISAFYIPKDSEVSVVAAVPAAVPAPPNVIGGFSAQDKISSLSFAGKSSLGSRARLSIFGIFLNPDALPAGIASNFVLLSSESAPVSDAVTSLNLGALPAIDGGVITWYTRATLKVNDHWLRRVRQGVVS